MIQPNGKLSIWGGAFGVLFVIGCSDGNSPLPPKTNTVNRSIAARKMTTPSRCSQADKAVVAHRHGRADPPPFHREGKTCDQPIPDWEFLLPPASDQGMCGPRT